jgi:membrane associated rhomboid family serine protease
MISSKRDIEKTTKKNKEYNSFLDHLTIKVLSISLFLSLGSLLFFSLFEDYKLMFGVIPREISGMLGVITGPWIHGDFAHWLVNSVSFSIGFIALRFFYPDLSFRILFWGYFATGIWLWVVGRPASHIGASGIVYMLFSFLFFKAFTEKDYRALVLPLLVLILFSGFFYGIIPGEVHISWEGHLMGFLAGLFLAIYFRKQKSIHWVASGTVNQDHTNEQGWEEPKEEEESKHMHHTGASIEFTVEFKENKD